MLESCHLAFWSSGQESISTLAGTLIRIIGVISPVMNLTNQLWTKVMNNQTDTEAMREAADNLFTTPAGILLLLRNTQTTWSCASITVATAMSYVHVTHCIQDLEKSGDVIVTKQGRVKILTLSDIGAAKAKAMSELLTVIRSAPSPPSAGSGASTTSGASSGAKTGGFHE